MKVTDEMVNRFLTWKLPEDFQPDSGVLFNRTMANGKPRPAAWWPIGTNLFTADQAREMLEYVLQSNFTGIAWLIESIHPHVVYFVTPGEWCDNPLHARKFATRAEAELQISELLMPEQFRASEHMWQ